MLHAERLLSARHLLGVTQSELAEAAELTQAFVSQIESHKREFTFSSAARFAHALNLPVEFFERQPSFPLDTLQYRKRATASARSTTRAQALFVEGFRITEELLEGSDYPRQTLPIVLDDDDDLSNTRIEAIAADTRASLGISTEGPVTNVTRTLERGGVAVAPIIVPDVAMDHHDGVSATAGREQAALVGIVPGSGDRQRFSTAHELGHLVLHSRRRAQDPEREAHVFAGAFLVPRPRAIQLIPPSATLNGLARTKSEWGVSIAALIKRGEAIGTLDRDRVQTLYRQLSNRGWRKQEPVEVGQETPRLLFRLMQLRFGEHPYANSSLSRDLALPVMTLRSLVPAPPQQRTGFAPVSDLALRRNRG